jgi:hypothetical protein
MTSTRLSVFALGALLSLTGAVLGDGEHGTLKEIAGYRQWTRVTDKPIPVENLAAGG